MRFEIIGKNNYVVTKAIEDYVHKRLDKVFNSLHENWVISARVLLKQYRDHGKVEVTIPCKGITLRSEASGPDMYSSIDKTVDKLLSQVRKHKEKLTNHLAKKGIKDIYSKQFLKDTEVISKEVLAQELVKSKEIELTPLTIDEAIIEMEMMGHDFYIFINKETNRVNVCYLRSDGDYAVIETK